MARLIQAAHFEQQLLERVSELVALKPHLRMQDRGQSITITLLGGTQVAVGSVSQTQDNLEDLGIRLDRKRLHSIALSVGRSGLLFRDTVIGAGFKPEKSLVQGATIVIGVDGGRLRTRRRKKGRKKESGHHRFDAEWREPKVLVIYEVDEKGRKMKVSYHRYDATMENCDAVFALIAGHLPSITGKRPRRSNQALARVLACMKNGMLPLFTDFQENCRFHMLFSIALLSGAAK